MYLHFGNLGTLQAESLLQVPDVTGVSVPYLFALFPRAFLASCRFPEWVSAGTPPEAKAPSAHPARCSAAACRRGKGWSRWYFCVRCGNFGSSYNSY